MNSHTDVLPIRLKAHLRPWWAGRTWRTLEKRNKKEINVLLGSFNKVLNRQARLI